MSPPRPAEPEPSEQALSTSAPLVPTDAAPHPFATPESVRYTRQTFIARGGMGRVSAVLDARLGREVAKKDVPPDAVDALALERRLAREAWVTARLDHPSIVPVHDAGTDSAGRPFFTMRLIHGRSLAAALAARDLDLPALLRHFLAVCHAIAHAHSRGVVHRDLKPDNIMLGPFGETQVVDWGVARLISDVSTFPDLDLAPTPGTPTPPSPPALPSAHTVIGARVGTSAWMSPEQSTGLPAGPPSDVYSLGLILRALLSPSPPAPPELAAILALALAPLPADRYATASELAADIAAYLDGHKVKAFTYSALDLARRFYRAFRAPIIVAAIAVVALVLTFVIAYSQTLDERDRALLAEDAATAALTQATAAEARTTAALAESESVFATLLVERAIEALQRGARAESELLAAHALTRVASPEASGVLARFAARAPPRLIAAVTPPDCSLARFNPAATALVCLEPDALSLWDLAPPPHRDTPALRWRLDGTFDEVGWVANDRLLVSTIDTKLFIDALTSTAFPTARDLTPSRALATYTRSLIDDGTALFVFDPATAELDHIAAAPSRLPRAISSDGRFALAYDESTRRPSLIDLVSKSHSPLHLEFDRDGPMSAALDPTGRLAAFGTPSGRLRIAALLPPATATPLLDLVLTTRPITHLAFSPDGAWLAARDERGFVTLVDPRSGQTLALPRVPAEVFAWGENAATLMTLGAELLTWHIPSSPNADTYRATAGISALALDPTGRLALADGRGAVSVFDLDSGERTALLEGDERAVAKDLAFTRTISKSEISRTHESSLAIAWPGRYHLAIWPFTATSLPEPLNAKLNYRRLIVLADGSVLAATYGNSLDRFAGPVSSSIRFGGGSVLDLVASVGGTRWAVVTSLGEIQVQSTDSTGATEVVRRLEHHGAHALALDRPGHTLVIATATTLRKVALTTGLDLAPPQVPTSPPTHLSALALSDDGTMTAAGTLAGRVLVWDASGHLVLDGRAHTQRVSDLAFAANGDLISASWDGTAIRWRPTVPPDVFALEATHGFGLDHAMRADLR